MFNLTKLTVAASIALLLVSCAPPPPPGQATGEYGSERISDEDSRRVDSFDDIFFELHREISRELERREEDEEQNIRLIEARSIVRIAEEVYLEGNAFLAIKLLNEAELHLRQAP